MITFFLHVHIIYLISLTIHTPLLDIITSVLTLYCIYCLLVYVSLLSAIILYLPQKVLKIFINWFLVFIISHFIAQTTYYTN